MSEVKLTDAQYEKFDILLSRLEPENISCDGEISQAQVRARYNRIMVEWKQLERQVGRKVSEDEASEWSYANWKKNRG